MLTVKLSAQNVHRNMSIICSECCQNQ